MKAALLAAIFAIALPAGANAFSFCDQSGFHAAQAAHMRDLGMGPPTALIRFDRDEINAPAGPGTDATDVRRMFKADIWVMKFVYAHPTITPGEAAQAGFDACSTALYGAMGR